MEGATTPMSELITDLTTVGTAVLGQVPAVASTITESPLLLFTVGFLFIGGCVGIMGRLISRG